MSFQRVRESRRQKSVARSMSRPKASLQKPNGVISPRVKQVGGEHFGIVCVDPAKHRSEWMMADFFGNMLIEPQCLEHQGDCFRIAMQMIRDAQQEHDIQDMIVVVERTGNYFLPPKRAFARAGFETRIVHPFATKQYRVPADPGNKTDETDLYAMHRAALAGFGLREQELESPYRELQLRVRHRRNLVQKAAALICQIREHLHLCMPGYASLFHHLFESAPPLAIARYGQSAANMVQLGASGLNQILSDNNIRHHQRTVDRTLAWARQHLQDPVQDVAMHHAIWTDLYDLHQYLRGKIFTLERLLAADLVKTPYVRLLAIPGICIVSAAELAGEVGPISHYPNANAITGRCGMYPARHQSDRTDHNSGPLVRQANKRMRCVLMRVADNIACHCGYYRGQAEADRALGVDKRASRVKISKRFTRLMMACVGGDQPMRHPCFQEPHSILLKLQTFHQPHETPVDVLLEEMALAVEQFPVNTRRREAEVVAALLEEQAKRKRDVSTIGELLPAILARLGVPQKQEDLEADNGNGDRP